MLAIANLEAEPRDRAARTRLTGDLHRQIALNGVQPEAGLVAVALDAQVKTRT